MRAKSANAARSREFAGSPPSSGPAGQPSPRGGLRLSKKVRLPLGPLCEGAPAAAGGGENCTATRNISGYGKVLSLRPYEAPPSQREVFRHAAPSPEEEGLNRSISPLACGPEMRYNTLNRIV